MIKIALKKNGKGITTGGLSRVFTRQMPKEIAETFAATVVPESLRIVRESISATAQRPTGRLADSYKARVIKTGSSDRLSSIELHSNKPYARIQNSGGVIKAKGGGKASYLTFLAYSGQWVRAKKVRIPGLRYLLRAKQLMRPVLSQFMKSAIRQYKSTRIGK